MSEEIKRALIEAKQELEMPREELLNKLWDTQQIIQEITEYIEDFNKHSTYGNKKVDESIKQEFHNIMLIIKYAKAKGSDK